MPSLRTCLMILLGCVVPALAQDRAVELSLQDAIDLALKEGYDARRRHLVLEAAEAQQAAEEGRARPQVRLVLSAPDFDERVQSVRLPDQLPVYNTIGSLAWGGLLNIEQRVPLTNTTLSFSSNFQQLRQTVFKSQTDTEDKNKQFLSNLTFSIRQPLIAPNTLKLDLETARLGYEQAHRQFTRDQLDIVYTVTRAFYTYYQALRTLEITRAEVERREQAYDLARRKFEAGLIPEVDALQSEVDLAQSRNTFLEAKGDLSGAADDFKLAVGLALEDRVTVRPDLGFTRFEVDSARAIAHGLRHRTDIRDAAIDRRLSEIALSRIGTFRAVRGEIAAYYDRTGVSEAAMPFSSGVGDLFESSWDDLRRRPRNVGVQFTLTVPVWDSGIHRAQVAAARARMRQRELDEDERRRRVILDIRRAITQFREAGNRVDVLRQSGDLARRSYDISLARFENGDITAQQLADAQDRLTRAEQAHLNAYIQYQLAVADLKRQTLYDFETGRSLINGAD